MIHGSWVSSLGVCVVGSGSSMQVPQGFCKHFVCKCSKNCHSAWAKNFSSSGIRYSIKRGIRSAMLKAQVLHWKPYSRLRQHLHARLRSSSQRVARNARRHPGICQIAGLADGRGPPSRSPGKKEQGQDDSQQRPCSTSGLKPQRLHVPIE